MHIIFLFDEFDLSDNPYNNTVTQVIDTSLSEKDRAVMQNTIGLALRPFNILSVRDLLRGNGVDVQFLKTTDVIPSHNYIFYWIELNGDAGSVIGDNIFSKIPERTKRVLKDYNITVVIDYTRECPIVREEEIEKLRYMGLNVETLNPWDNIRSFMRKQQVFSKSLDIDTVLLLSHDMSSLLKNMFNEPGPTGTTNNSTLRLQNFDIFIWLYLYNLKAHDEKLYDKLYNNTSDLNKTLTAERGVPAVSSKPVLSLLGTAKLHRAYIFEQLMRTGVYPDRSNASIFWSGYSADHTKQLLAYYKKESLEDEKYDFIKQQNTSKDYTFDTDGYDNLRTQDLYINKNVLNDSLVSIVGESWIHEPVFTEKTLKTFEWKTIPLIFGGVGLLKKLHTYGFKFIPEFDYSYDNFHINDIERVWLFNKEIEKLSKMSNEQIHKLYVDNIDIINHNYNLLRSINLKSVFKELIDRLVRYKPNPVKNNI